MCGGEGRGPSPLTVVTPNLFYLGIPIFPREARPKASRSGVYNFVPQRAQAGRNLVWSLRSCIFISLFLYLFICEVGVCRK